MKDFLCEDFLLATQTARTLYHEYAEKMPIIDYHCHIDPSEIARNRKFENITQAWLGGDHYKWRLMRSNGVAEEFITGGASDRDKFQKFAEALSRSPGHPLYHWSHLELKRYFGCETTLTPGSAEEIWRVTGEKLKSMSVRGIITASNVRLIGTTDDPADTLEWHKKIKDDSDFDTTVVPSMRPDRALSIEKPDFAEYIDKLANAAGMDITSLDDLRAALRKRMDFFGGFGCRASDHGLDYVPYRRADDDEVAAIFKKALSGKTVTFDHAEAYKTEMLLFLGREYFKRGWAMQLHYGVIRNANSAMFDKIGSDTGFDCIALTVGNRNITAFLDALAQTGELPKTVIYSLDPSDDIMLGSLIGCFQNSDAVGKIQHGAAWWFNDTKDGIEKHLRGLASQSALGNFIGMLTDSRSFLSYTRHEYFRRILCNLLGGWVENGEYPNDIPALGEIVRDICYNNAARYFGV